jgi:hypothetical protein
MFARVIEIDTPFTTSPEQSHYLQETAADHYGWGLPAIAERGLSPQEWGQWCAKAKLALEIPAGEITGRAGAHLAGGLAGARLLGDICGIKGYHEPVFDAAKETMAGIIDDLGYKGETPTIQYLLAVHDAMARDPALFPPIGDVGSSFQAPGIYGWNLANHNGPGDVALLPSGLERIAREYETADPLVVLKELKRERKLHQNEHGKHLTRQIKVAGQRVRAYVISGITKLVEALDDNDEATGQTGQTDASTHSGTHPVPTSVPTQKSGLTSEVPIVPTFSGRTSHEGNDLTSLSNDTLAAMVNTTVDDATLDRVLAELDRRSLPPDAAVDGRKGAPEGKFSLDRGVTRLSGAQRPVTRNRRR